MITVNAEISETLPTDYTWFHSIRLDAHTTTPGRYPNNETLFPVYFLLDQLALEGLDCIDIGCMDGIVALTMEQRGARSVMATDLWDRPSIPYLREYLDSSMTFLPETAVEEIAPRIGSDACFDLTVFSGVLYHVIDPLASLIACRRLTRNGGFAIVETACRDGEDATMTFTPGEAIVRYDEPTTFWLPTERCLESMLQLAGFQPCCGVRNGDRYAVLAQAQRPSQMTEAPPWVQVTHAYMAPPVANRYLDIDQLERAPDHDISSAWMPPAHKRYEIRPPRLEEHRARFVQALHHAETAGCRRLALYGGGTDARRLAQFLTGSRLASRGLEFVAVVDDQLSKDGSTWEAGGVQLPLLAAAQLSEFDIDGLVLTSSSYQDTMYRQATSWNQPLTILPLYDTIDLPALEPVPTGSAPCAWPA